MFSLCWFCKHFDWSQKLIQDKSIPSAATSEEKYFHIVEDKDYHCKAFPEGVPPLILGIGAEYYFTTYPQFDHREPIGVDNGIQFELASLSKLRQRPPFISLNPKQIENYYDETLDWINQGRLLGFVLPTK